MLLVGSISASAIELTPETLTLELTGGCSIKRAISIKNTNSEDLLLEIETSVSPNSDGIDINYSVGSPFVVKAKKTLTVLMYINASMLLLPDQYIINTKFFGDFIEGTSNGKSEGGNGGKGVDQTVYIIEQNTPDYSPQENENPVKPSYVPDDESIPLEPEHGVPLAFFGLILGLLFVIFLLLFEYGRRKRYEKN